MQWADAEFVGMSVDYDAVDIRLLESGGRRVVVRALGHIGVSMSGFWDEVVVEAGGVSAGGSLQVDAESKVRVVSNDLASPSGCTARNSGQFWTLSVKFIDGCVLQVVASEFEVIGAPP